MGRKPIFVIPTAGKSREQMKAEAREALAAWQEAEPEEQEDQS